MVFWVQDNGEGLSPEALKLVFDEKNDARQKIIKGNGLGLNIVKNIIAKLDGQVDMTPGPGRGSLFSFSLPAA